MKTANNCRCRKVVVNRQEYIVAKEIKDMSPLDMLIMLFFILVTIQAVKMSIHWDREDK